eukprot:2711938-Pyramimonas_sp.AAC.1
MPREIQKPKPFAPEIGTIAPIWAHKPAMAKRMHAGMPFLASTAWRQSWKTDGKACLNSNSVAPLSSRSYKCPQKWQ